MRFEFKDPAAAQTSDLIRLALIVPELLERRHDGHQPSFERSANGAEVPFGPASCNETLDAVRGWRGIIAGAPNDTMECG